MSIYGGPNIINDGLILYLDTGNIKSYAGEPTTNFSQQISNYTGSNYAGGAEWSSDPTRFSKTHQPSIATPIGFGATLCSETATTGFYHLSGMGGGSESGEHSISCYIYPLSSITNFTIGLLGDGGNMITFNFVARTITYGGGISNRNAFMNMVVGFPGWYRVGANIEGRFGGWVGCIGLSTNATYTPISPYKSFYITGLQYEYKTHCTPYVFGTRSNTQGLFDLAAANTLDLINSTFDNNAQITFNGSGNYITTPTINLGNTFTVSAWFNSSDVNADTTIVGTDANGCDNWLGVSGGYLYGFVTQTADVNNFTFSGATTLSNNKWYHTSIVVNGNTATLYLNGKQDYTTTTAFTIGAWNGTFSIGRRCPSVAQRFFNGKIDIVSMCTRSLTASEILRNYNAVKSRFGL